MKLLKIFPPHPPHTTADHRRPVEHRVQPELQPPPDGSGRRRQRPDHGQHRGDGRHTHVHRGHAGLVQVSKGFTSSGHYHTIIRANLPRSLFPYVIHPIKGMVQTSAIYMVVAVAAERYKAICHPLRYVRVFVQRKERQFGAKRRAYLSDFPSGRKFSVTFTLRIARISSVSSCDVTLLTFIAFSSSSTSQEPPIYLQVHADGSVPVGGARDAQVLPVQAHGQRDRLLVRKRRFSRRWGPGLGEIEQHLYVMMSLKVSEINLSIWLKTFI